MLRLAFAALAALALAVIATWAPGPRAVRSPSPDAPPRVFLNHFYVVLDQQSYDALQQSSFLTAEWAPFEKRTTARNDRTYTGIYWYGRRTYYEAFAPGGQGPIGSSGLALSVDGKGESAAVKTLWAGALGEADGGLVTRKTETGEAPWFEMTYAKAATEGLRTWLMEYHPDFLARWYPELTPARGTTRSEVLDRYVAKIGRAGERDKALLKDVTGLVIALETADRDVLERQLQAVGWTARSALDGMAVEGPEGVVLRVVPASAGRRGILEAAFSLQKEAAPRTASFGTTVLTVEKDRARLAFVP
jgi:Family of unknown function (DUF5829)